jgi:hypothetical protein
MTLVAAQLLEAHPDVGLYVFDEMTDVNRPVGVGQSAGDQNATAGSGHGRTEKPEDFWGKAGAEL